MITAVIILGLFAQIHSLQTSFKRAVVTKLNAANGPILSTKDIPPVKDAKVTTFGNPKVIPPGKLGTEWLLWHHARDDKFSDDIVKLNSGRVLFATSQDGFQWNYHPDIPALSPSKEDGDWFLFDSEHVGIGDVIEPGQVAQSKFRTQQGMLFMYIFGGNGESKPSLGNPDRIIKGSKMEIGVAVSQDGAHWSRVEGPSAHGAILEVGKENDFDHLFVAFPSVIEVGSDYKMFYHTYDSKIKKYCVGLAVASDGLLNWKKKGPVLTGGNNPTDFDYTGVTRRFIGQMEDGTYQMWYEGVAADGTHSIGLARSTDRGNSWNKVYNTPIFAASTDPAAWDNGGVSSPHLVWLPEKRRWRMYYMGHNSDKSIEQALGVAESTDESGHAFVRLQI